MRNITALLILAISPLSAQDLSISYHDPYVTYNLKTRDSVYILGDTVLVTFAVQNNSDSGLFVFDPIAYYADAVLLDLPFQDVHLGGNWWNILGFSQEIVFARMGPHGLREWQLKFALGSTRQAYAKLAEDIRIPVTTQTNLIRFYVAYIPESALQNHRSSMGIPPKTFRGGRLKIENDSVGVWVETQLRRVFLGPLAIQIVNR